MGEGRREGASISDLMSKSPQEAHFFIFREGANWQQKKWWIRVSEYNRSASMLQMRLGHKKHHFFLAKKGHANTTSIQSNMNRSGWQIRSDGKKIHCTVWIALSNRIWSIDLIWKGSHRGRLTGRYWFLRNELTTSISWFVQNQIKSWLRFGLSWEIAMYYKPGFKGLMCFVLCVFSLIDSQELIELQIQLILYRSKS